MRKFDKKPTRFGAFVLICIAVWTEAKKCCRFLHAVTTSPVTVQTSFTALISVGVQLQRVRTEQSRGRSVGLQRVITEQSRERELFLKIKIG